MTRPSQLSFTRIRQVACELFIRAVAIPTCDHGQPPFFPALLACSHHICLEVDNLNASMAHAGRRVRLLNSQPKLGAHGLPVAFLHPKDMCGVLTELEEAGTAPQPDTSPARA